MGATVYAVGYPRAAPGPQSFTLANLGSRTITLGLRASGMVAWVTIDEEMMPIGPMSVYSIDPAVTGLPLGQYVCGFAISNTP